MKRRRGLKLAATVLVGLSLLVIFSIAGASPAVPQMINYQGRLTDASGNPLNGTYSITFKLYSVGTGGSAIWTETHSNVNVSNGLFNVLLGSTTPLDASKFTGTTYLGVTVGSDPEMTPRQRLVSVPYALVAATCESGGAGWLLTGNSGTNPSTNFLGTTDNQPLEIRVNNERALRIELNGTSPNIIGGFSGNSVTLGVVGATICGGGEGPSPDESNLVTDDYGIVGGGLANQAGDNAGTTSDRLYATVGGGYGNDATNTASTVGGGQLNTASGVNSTVSGGTLNGANGYAATVCGGVGNAIHSYAFAAMVGGGDSNTVSAYADWSTVSGGAGNRASSRWSMVGGGQDNTASGENSMVGGGYTNTASGPSSTVAGGANNIASGPGSTVAGGAGNTASSITSTVCGGEANTASGIHSMVVGGYGNTASGLLSFAAGSRAQANHGGTFVWADTGVDMDFASTADNQFSVRATGGTRFVSAVDPDGNPTAGVQLAPGGNSWSSISDRNLKENFTPVNGRRILEQLSLIPITRWNMKAQNPSIRHIGPMAQDFYAAFGLGESDRYISSSDADGIALLSIQALYKMSLEKDQKIEQLTQELKKLRASNVALQAQMETLLERMAKLEQIVKERQE